MYRWAIVASLLLSANIAYADVLYTQTATTSSLTGNTSGRTIHSFGTSTYATVPNYDLDSIELQMRGCVGFGCAGSSVTLIAEVFNGTAWVGVATSSTETVSAGSTPETVVFEFSTFNLKTAHDSVSGSVAKELFVSQQQYWYRFRTSSVGLGLADSYGVWGQSTGTTTANFIWQRQDSSTISPAITFNGTDQTVTTTRIDSLDSPPDGSTTPTTSVTFDWTIYFNSGTSIQDVTGIEIQDVTNGAIVVSPAEQNITASGYSTYTTNKTLISGNQYLWRAYMRDTTGAQGYIYSSFNSFYVVSSQYPLSLNVASTSVGSTTASLIPNYESIYNYIITKPPFGFIFQTKSAIEQLNASSTPAFQLEQEENITENILSPLDIGLAWILGLMYTFYLVRRFSHMEI